MKKQGWKVTPRVKLPEGYDLHEDASGLYLYTESEIVGSYALCHSPHAIRYEAVMHRDKSSITAQHGFTLIELLVALTIMMLISAIAYPLYNNVRQEARETAFNAQVSSLEQAGQLHILNGGGDVIWHAEAGMKARDEISGDHETWFIWFDEWPENPLDNGDFTVIIEDGEVSVSPGVE